jgi:hypothetical protein
MIFIPPNLFYLPVFFDNDHALGGGFMKLADEGIAAGLERPDPHNDAHKTIIATRCKSLFLLLNYSNVRSDFNSLTDKGMCRPR